MRARFLFPILVLVGVATVCGAAAPFYITALDSAKSQLARLTASLGTTYTRFPRTASASGTLTTVDYSDWTSGFYSGCLWLMYRYTADTVWKDRARKFTDNLAQAATVNDHDVGFRIFCSYGSGLGYQTAQQYKLDTTVMMRAARTLSGRYNGTVKAIKSWDTFTKGAVTYTYPVIIDNMMNLELLCWATAASHDSSFLKTAVSHANTTIKNHFRSDYSSFHVVAYNAADGSVMKKMTAQGYSDSSSWARGQAWGLYGYTMMYRETSDTAYLNLARNIANYIISRLPADLVPNWDFDAPASPAPPRDASAAAIYASALIELSTMVQGAESLTYYQKAKAILQSLASSAYTAKPNTSGNFILLHSTGNKPSNAEINVPIIYADYYYLEALLRLKKREEGTAALPNTPKALPAGSRGNLKANPLAGSAKVVITLDNPALQSVMLCVFDTRGRIVREQSTRETHTTLDFAALPVGCYVLQASGGSFGTARIVHR